MKNPTEHPIHVALRVAPSIHDALSKLTTAAAMLKHNGLTAEQGISAVAIDSSRYAEEEIGRGAPQDTTYEITIGVFRSNKFTLRFEPDDSHGDSFAECRECILQSLGEFGFAALPYGSTRGIEGFDWDMTFVSAEHYDQEIQKIADDANFNPFEDEESA